MPGPAICIEINVLQNAANISHQQEAAQRLFRLGLYADAETAFREIVKHDRGAAEAWNMLGISLQRQGKTDAAIAALQTAMDVAPHAPEVVVNLGNLYKECGDIKKAVRFYRKALGLEPAHVMAHVNLANCLIELGELDLAESHAQQALAIEGRSQAALHALASVKERQGDFAKAVEILESGVSIFPDHPDMLLHLGCACSMAKRYQESITALLRALELRPGFVEAMASLSQVYFEAGSLEEAEEHLLEALRIRPDMKELHINLANVRLGQCRNDEALVCFKRVFEIDPESASSHFICGMAYLVKGDFANGWREYAWRWRTEKYRPKLDFIPAPEWHGESLENKILFVHAEQGIGDTLQFVRYLPLIDKHGGKIVLEVQPLLKRLLSRLPGIDGLIENGEMLPAMDFHVPLLNIPGIMRTDLSSIPSQVPYLSVDKEARDGWRRRLEILGPGIRVGIAWAGSPTHANDHNRSMALAQLAPLAAVSGVQWVSLQKGPAAGQIRDQDTGFELTDWTEDLHDFEDTAALVDCLDLVLAVDTSVVHLAGALNKPVWAMIPFAPDWRWLLDRTDSPWYPSLRLFRQSVRGNWDAVVSEVVQALKLRTKVESSVAT